MTFNLIKSAVKQQKVFALDGNMNLVKRNPKFAKYYTAQDVKCSDLRSMFKKLLEIQEVKNAPFYSIIRGEWLPFDEIDFLEDIRKHEVETKGQAIHQKMLDSLYEVEEDGKVAKLRRKEILNDVPRYFVCFDFDGLHISGLGEFDVRNPEVWIDAAVEQELGPEFSLADRIVQLSSSAGVSEGLRAHVWFWLSVPLDGAAWRAWFAARAAVLGRKPAIDKSLFEAERVHYIAAPSFVGSAEDPCEGLERFQYVERFEPSVDLRDIGSYLSASKVAAELRAIKGVTLDGEEDEAQDAWSRPGVVGAFNRVFSISDVIERFLPEHYVIATADGRVTWLGSESGSVESCKIFGNNTKMFSTSGSDPFEGNPRNAFDLIEHWLHDGDFRGAAAWAEALTEVKAELDRTLGAEFDEYSPAEGFAFEWVVERLAVAVKDETPTPESMMRDYPMPSWWGGGKAKYKLVGSSWFYGYVKKDEEDREKPLNLSKKEDFVKLWSPITMVRELMVIGTSAISVEFKIMGADGKAVTLVIPRRDFGRSGGDLLAKLEELGWLRAGKGSTQFLEYVNSTRAGSLKSALNNRGWNERGSHFATPGGEVFSNEGEGVILNPERAVPAHIAKAGTFEGWQSAIERILTYDACAHWPIAVASSFVGPLTKIMSRPTSGLALCGESSFGKTTALMLGVSAWTSPDENKQKDGGLFASMRSTANSVEVHAENANHTLLALDETGHMAGKDIEALVFALASGTGKSRMNVSGKGFRASNSWQTFVMLSGEFGLAQRYEADTGKKMAKGAAARVLDINIDLLENVRLPDMSPITDIQLALKTNYGHAGPMFVKALFERGYDTRGGELEGRRKAIAKNLSSSYSGLEGRVADILSIVFLASELVVEFEILPSYFSEKVQSAGALIWTNFMSSAPANKDTSILDDISRWLTTKLGSSVVSVLGDGRKFKDTEAWHSQDTFYVPTQALEKICGGALREASIVKTLNSSGVLLRQYDRNVSRYIPGVGKNIPHYRLDAKVLGIEIPDCGFSEEENLG